MVNSMHVGKGSLTLKEKSLADDLMGNDLGRQLEGRKCGQTVETEADSHCFLPVPWKEQRQPDRPLDPPRSDHKQVSQP